MAMEDLVPRQDISGKLDEAFVEMLNDKNWKVGSLSPDIAPGFQLSLLV